MTNKGVSCSNTIIIIIEKDGNLVSDEKDLVNFFNNHYINIVENTIGKKPNSLGNPSDVNQDHNTASTQIIL